jgi:predicted GTPase
VRCTCEQARRAGKTEALREVAKKLADMEYDASAVRMVLRMIDLPQAAPPAWPDNPTEGGAL